MKESRRIGVKCKACGREFKAYASTIKGGRGKFCSKQCYYESLKVSRAIVLPKTKICNLCKLEKPIDEFHRNERNKKFGLSGVCKECNIKHAMDYYYSNQEKVSGRVSVHTKADRKNPEKYASAKKNRSDLYWAKALEFFGPCACCGESTKEFLSIDHINGHGNDFRKFSKQKAGVYLLQHFNSLGWPEELKAEYRILCMNCNIAIGKLGYCPHHPERKYPYWNPSTREWDCHS